MNEFLIKLRKQLVAILEEIDKFNVPLDHTISIKKVDFKSIKFLGSPNDSFLVYEYKKDINFGLSIAYSPYHKAIYNQLMNGTLEELNLEQNPISDKFISIGMNKVLLNYRLEDEQNTIIRNLYNSPST